MTVAEHILFYSLLKGRPIAEAAEEVENMLQDLGLPHKRDELIQNLSGLSGCFYFLYFYLFSMQVYVLILSTMQTTLTDMCIVGTF